MLVVTDNGVKIQLVPQKSSGFPFHTNIVIAILLALVGIALTIMGLPLQIGIALVILIIGSSIVRHRLTSKSTSIKHTSISGGEILVTPYQIEHFSKLGQKMVYPLPQQIQFKQSNLQLSINDTNNQPLLTIAGFSQPQHVTVAHAILQGKSIKTQGKAIKMQSSVSK